MDWNHDAPLELCEALGETVKANDYLLIYYSMGSSRSLEKLSHHTDVSITLRQLQRYSSDYQWIERVKAQYQIDSLNARDKLGELKAEILENFAVRLNEAIQSASLEDSSLSQLATGLRALFDAWIVQYDAAPTRRVQTLSLNGLSFEQVLQEYQNVENSQK